MDGKRRVVLALSAVALLVAGFVAGASLFRPRPAPADEQAARRILYYRSPHDPQVTSPTPRKDPMGMDYVPVYADEAPPPPSGAGAKAVRIDPRVTQELGVTTEPVQVRRIERVVRTVGMVRPDERRLYSISVKFPGWVERLHVNFTGDRVRRGEPLADLYSPELLATQQEFLLALRHARRLGAQASPQTRAQASELLQGAKQRLRLWDVSDAQIEAIARRGRPLRALTVYAPADGIVLDKEILAGAQVQPGQVLMRIADLRDVWVFAQIYPHELAWIRAGQEAEVRVAGVPGPALKGRVDYIQPVVSPEARTVEVRIQVAQPREGVVFKPNMYANVEIESAVEYRSLAIPEQAVLRTGERTVAVVALGGGYFEPREVRLGVGGAGYVEVLEGVRAGETVVTSSQFLLDSESNLRAALGAMGAGAPGHPGHTSGAPVGGSGAAAPEQPPGGGADAGSTQDAGHGPH